MAISVSLRINSNIPYNNIQSLFCACWEVIRHFVNFRARGIYNNLYQSGIVLSEKNKYVILILIYLDRPPTTGCSTVMPCKAKRQYLLTSQVCMPFVFAE